jgi:Zn-dependent protease/predicted transcriptional regulator
MESSIQIGSIFGIPVKLHFTFLLVIPLFAWIIGSQIVFTARFLEASFGTPPLDLTLITAGPMPYVLGVIVALGLFAGVFIHELAHCLVARSRGIRINSITLLILGGIASMEERMPDPKVELPMALAGPLTSLGIGALCSGIGVGALYLIPDPAVAALVFFIFGYLGLLNVILFIFNLIPAFPMDGGRVLRAWLAGRMPLHKATQIAADIGRGFAIVFGIVGFVLFNPILIIIAFFIYIGANQESAMVRFNVLLHDVMISDAMSSPVVTVPPALPVEDAIAMMYSTHHLGFPVTEGDQVIGMVTLSDVHSVSPIDRPAMQVRDIMTKGIISLPPGAPLTDAMRIMSMKNIGRIPVIANGQLLGIVTRTDILRVMELKEV